MLGILLPILASIPIGFIIVFTSPWIKTKWSSFSDNARNQQIEDIRKEFSMFEEFRRGSNTNKLLAYLACSALNLCGSLFGALIVMVTTIVIITKSELKFNPGFFKLSHAASITQLVVLLLMSGFYVAVQLISALVNARSLRFKMDYILANNEEYRHNANRALQKLGSSPLVQRPGSSENGALADIAFRQGSQDDGHV